MATVTDFIFLDSKITADGDCSHKIKRRLLLGRKAMTNLDSILKSRDITLLVCEMSATVWSFEHSLALPFLEIGMKLTFSSPVATAEFSTFPGILSARLSGFHSLPHSGIGVLRVAGLGMPGCGTDIMGTTC